MRLINSKICLTYTNVLTESHCKLFCFHPLNYRNSLCFSAFNFNLSWWDRKINKWDFKLSLKSILGLQNMWLGLHVSQQYNVVTHDFWLQLEKGWLVLSVLNSLEDQMLDNIKRCFPGPAWRSNNALISNSIGFVCVICSI